MSRSRDYTLSGKNLDAVIISTKLTLLDYDLIQDANFYGYLVNRNYRETIYTLAKIENDYLYFGDPYFTSGKNGSTPEIRLN